MSRIKKYSLLAVGFMMVILLISCVLIQDTYAAASKPQLKNDPINGQMLPYYEVWLRWNDVSNESSYTMNLRNLSTNTSIYSQKYVSPNSTYFVVPTSVLTRGDEYRWCVCSVDASGNKTYSDAHIFWIEPNNPDGHLKTTVYNTRRMEYFVYAETPGYDAILNSAAQAWNGIANVSLVRTGSPTDGKYEIGIYESPITYSEGRFGHTITTFEPGTNIFVSAEIRTYRDNIINYYNSGTAALEGAYIPSYSAYFLPNAMHEVGHALGLKHTSQNPGIHFSYEDFSLVPLIMNSGPDLASTLNVVDRDHLRMKWGV